MDDVLAKTDFARNRPAEPAPDDDRINHWQLKLFAIRCRELSDRVLAGQVALADAADMLQSAAEWSGLVDRFGQDAIQEVMARAFIQTEAR